MLHEHIRSKNDERADAVMQLIRSGKFKTVPEAVEYLLINELVTNKSDVERITREVGIILQARQRALEEDGVWDNIEHEEMLRGAEHNYWQRGGDPKD